jgi:hypothetical protein
MSRQRQVVPNSHSERLCIRRKNTHLAPALLQPN